MGQQANGTEMRAVFHPIARRFRVTTQYAARAAHGVGGKLLRESFHETEAAARAYAETLRGARIHEAMNGATWPRGSYWKLLSSDSEVKR